MFLQSDASSDDSADLHKNSGGTTKSSWNKKQLRCVKRLKVKSGLTYKVRDARCLGMLRVPFGAALMEAAAQIRAVLCCVCM